jgi:hypothetical protein
MSPLEVQYRWLIIVGLDNNLKLQPANEFATTVARTADILH